jgi:soluble lytic murein transglycosylase
MKPKIKILGLCIALILSGCAGPSSVIPPTSSPSLAPGITPFDTALPTLTPSPTPTPEVRIDTGEQALFIGDFDRAFTEYQTALDDSNDPELQAAALWGLGRTEYAIKNHGRALLVLRQLTSQFPESPNSTRAYFLMGEIFMALTRYAEAAQAYTVYLALRPGVIDAHVQELRGDAYAAADDDLEAVAAYQAALSAAHVGDDTALQIKIAQATTRLGDTTTALGIYDSLFTGSENTYLKAQMDLLSGQIYLSQGQTDQAYQRFIHAVDNYPWVYDSYSALVALVNAGVPVDEMNRGLTDYFAGQYGYALDAFHRYIAANPENDGTVYYYIAMALNKKGDYQEAINEFTFYIENFPDNATLWQSAWDEKSYTQWAILFEYEAAVETLLAFVQRVPADANAPSYLMQAARNQERDGKLEEAALTWDRVANEYPSSEFVPQALFWAGIARYRLEKYSDALVAFQRDSILSTSIADQTRALFWIGKTQQTLGDLASAQTTWQQTATLDPTDYYSLRAQDMLYNRPAFDPAPAVNLTVNLTAERAEAEAWLRVICNLPPDTELNSIGALLGDLRLIRGTEFWKLDLDSQAYLEFESLRTAVEGNVAESYRLANYLLDLGAYRSAINIFELQVLPLAGLNTYSQMFTAPIYFNHVRFGLYYQDLILSAAQNNGIDPLFLFSVVRQESLFDKYAGSGQGALGLMQITPDTGQFISDNIGWPLNYSTEDLYRPVISIGLGTNYLMKQSLRFDGDLSTTLAAYNAGPNTAPIWRGLSGPDTDLFVEVIRFEETRNYIRSIYEIFAFYRSLYTTIP